MSRRINVTFDDDTYMHIQRLAAKDNRSMSDLIRIYTEDGLSGQLNKDNIDFITDIIRSQVRDVMSPSVERLASLSAKTCIEATTAAYLTAETIAKFVPAEYQEALIDVYEKARKKAIASIRVKQD